MLKVKGKKRLKTIWKKQVEEDSVKVVSSKDELC